MYDVKLSRRLKLKNSSRADSCVNSLKSNVSGTISVRPDDGDRDGP
jgi:hypothetical protein